MKLHTHQLSKGPLDLEIRCRPEEVNLNDTDLGYVGEVVGNIRFTQVDKGRILAQGNVEAMLHFGCVRCLEMAMSTVRGEIVAVYEAAPDHAKKQQEEDPFDQPDDHTFVRYDGESLNPGPEIREALMMGVPDFPICRPDCAGLCLTCGSNLNLGLCKCTRQAKELPGWKSALQRLKADAPE